MSETTRREGERFCPDCVDEDWSDLKRDVLVNPCETHEILDVECCPICLAAERDALRERVEELEKALEGIHDLYARRGHVDEPEIHDVVAGMDALARRALNTGESE